MTDLKIEIIISRFNEDLKWTIEGIFNDYKYTVYNKGDNDNFEKTNVNKIINLENIGRCDHTYLYHIINNYDNLSDIIVFFPGSLDLKIKKPIAITLLTEIKSNKQAIFLSEYFENVYTKFNDFKLDSWKSSSLQNYSKNNEYKLQLSDIRPFGEWFKHYFANENENEEINTFCYLSIFSVDKMDILQHPLTRYITFINQVNTKSNPEVGHYLERSWGALFHPLKYTKIILNPL